MAKSKSHNNKQTIIFVLVICFACALILSLLASVLKKPQATAQKLYQSKQLLIAANILGYDGTFLLDGKSASYNLETHTLSVQENAQKATQDQILDLYKTRVSPRVTNASGVVKTFDEANLNLKTYIEENKKTGYSKLEWKLVYFIMPNGEKSAQAKPAGFVLPINGFGLWGPIYGYLGLAANADTVVGMTWYDQAETPGLGGDIGLPDWQKQFDGKVIFQEGSSGSTDYSNTYLGLKVVKGKVKELYGDSPEGKNAVDGISGATITGNGVSEAYRRGLAPYRTFLIKISGGKS